jgi:hypothetical protein
MASELSRRSVPRTKEHALPSNALVSAEPWVMTTNGRDLESIDARCETGDGKCSASA